MTKLLSILYAFPLGQLKFYFFLVSWLLETGAPFVSIGGDLISSKHVLGFQYEEMQNIHTFW